MNKITKPILISALSALAFGTVGVAGTFALFTDNTETAISAKAGIVDVGLTPSGLTTYSAQAVPADSTSYTMVDERGGKYISVPTQNNTFTNGGTASLTEGVLSMDRLTPGDRVTFQAGLVNHSNVDIKYRLVYKFTGTSGVLAQGLVTKTNLSGSAKTYEGLREFVAPWTFLEAGAALPSTAITFDIELPIDRGNDYQGKEASFSLYVEAVQGNAYVEDEARTLLFGSLTPTQEATQKVEDLAQPIVLQTTSEMATTTVKTTIPANTSYQTESQQTDEPITAGDTVKLVVSDLVVAEDPATKKGTVDLDIALLVNGVEVTQFSEFVNVEVSVGKNLDITSVTHNGKAVTGYTYTASEGILRFTTKSFSPFSVEYSIVPNTSYGFFDSYVQDGHWVHVVSTKDQFKNILVNIRDRSGQPPAADTFHGGKVAYPLADKTTVYVLANDINCGGTMWETSEAALFGTRFIGTFDGADHTISNIHLTSANADTIKAGLFSDALYATFQNLTLADMSIDDTGSGAHGLLGVGPSDDATGARIGTHLTFKNITIAEGCFIRGKKNCGGLFAYARSIQTVTLENCVNHANISVHSSSDGYVAGGFIASATSAIDPVENHSTRTFTIKNCQNHGNISAVHNYGGVAGAIGATNSNDKTVYNIDGFLNTGNITDESSNAVGPVIAGQSNSINRSNDTYNLSGIINNTGIITKADANKTDYAFGLFTKDDDSTSPILSNGYSVTTKEFFANHVIASGVVAFDADAVELNTAFDANSKLTLDLSALDAGIWAQAAKIRVSTKLTWAAPISYSDNVGYGAGAGQYGVHEEVIDIEDLSVKTYEVARLCYAGHTYPAGKDPADIHIYYDGNEIPGPNTFTYNHEHFKLEGTDARRGYGLTTSGAAYFVLDNDAVVGGQYRLFAENYTETAYVIEVFNADNEKLAYSSITDFNRQIQSTYRLGTMAQAA